MIEVENLVKRYGDVEALGGVGFVVQPGEVLGYLGPNGAGKSTTVKILTGLVPADSGSARICGFDIATQPLEAKRRVGLVPETGALYEPLTPREYLRFIGDLYALPRAESAARGEELLDTMQLDVVARDRRMVGFSKGMKQRVVIAAALLHRPRVLILDEPLDGLDVSATITVKALIAREAAAGCTILFCSHLLDVVERVCSRVVILASGRVQVDGSLSEILHRYPGKTLETVFQETTGAAVARAAVAAAESR